jgi:polyisoprenoid-binding protein YceI
MATRYEIDNAHSTVGFVVRHMVFSKVRGGFTRFGGVIMVDDQDPTRSTVEAKIEAASINTADEKRDGHLRSADFFDTERYPALSFTSRRVEITGERRLRVTGDLSIRDKTREVALEVEENGRAKNPWGQEIIGFSGRTSVDRKDYGLGWNQILEAGGVLVGDTITIELELEAVKK